MSIIDRLKLHRLAGGNIISYAPLFAPTGEFLFLISESSIYVYSTTTGQHVRELVGANSKIIGMELQLHNDDILVACTETGELLYFKWSNGQIKGKLQLKLPKGVKITSFNQLDWYGDSETANVFLIYKRVSGKMAWAVYETRKGCYIELPCTLSLNENSAISAVNTKAFKIICIAQAERIYFIDYITWLWIGLSNGLKVPITCLQWHPAEEMIATGDKQGRIFLWREFWDKKTVKNRLYHWHSTPVTSVAFTPAGSGFYSSGMEAVVVNWNVDRPKLRKFIPHITNCVRHIAVSNANVRLSISTIDNGVQILGNDHFTKCNLQEFTYIDEYGSGNCRFPVGLRLDPRSSSLVLNGRVGHLQFYSTHTRSLLYNLDVVCQNQLTMELEHILYNINVTKVAFNVDWMATGEVFNDQEHFPELRLKFWKYVEESQSYALNTNIEIPHEGGFKAIEFSSPYQLENLLCATVGEDNVIKVWALYESDNIYKNGKVWYCIAETNYKNLPIEAVSFSQDGSLLAAGYANTLCIFKSDTLKLKAALNASPGIDGCIAKAEIRLPTQKMKSEKPRKETDDVMKMFASTLDNTDETLIKKLRQNNTPDKLKKFKSRTKLLPHDLSNDQKNALFRHITDTQSLNFFQQLLVFQRLKIQCKVTPLWHDKMLSYLKETIYKAGLTERVDDLNVRLRRMNIRHRFKAKYRLQQYIKHNPNAASSDKLLSIMSILGLKDNSFVASEKSMKTNKMDIDIEEQRECPKTIQTLIKDDNVEPRRNLATIKHVQFAANEHGHLVIVCTETRVLIWNLLTLRLESKLNLSTKHLAFDPLTNLAAVFDKNNELHIFQPKVPIPIYERAELPNVLGAVWLPRRYPKASSIHIDWQSQSRLYFFTENQEILYLHDPNSQDLVELPTVTFKNPSENVGLRYSTFGTFATQQITEKQNVKQNNGPLIAGSAGRTAVKMLVDMSTHTMPPISLVCNDFIKSLVKPVDLTTANIIVGNNNDNNSRKTTNGAMNGWNGECKTSDDESDEDQRINVDGSARMMNGLGKTKTKDIATKMSAEASRKSIVAKSEEMKLINEKRKTKEQNEKFDIETELNKIATLSLDLEF